MDTVSREKRSEIMKKVKRENTRPELILRRALHAAGLRYRLHRSDLPGTPDIVIVRHRIAIFVHGCYWHRHAGCKKATTPKSRQEWWEKKFINNVNRDTKNCNQLNEIGWRVVVAWQCQIENSLSSVVSVIVDKCQQ